jgi:hypothetical protein
MAQLRQEALVECHRQLAIEIQTIKDQGLPQPGGDGWVGRA